MDDIGDSANALAHEDVPMLARNLFGWFFDDSNRAGPALGGVIATRLATAGDRRDLGGDERVDALVSVSNGSVLVLWDYVFAW